MPAFKPNEIQWRSKLELSTRLADICLEKLQAHASRDYERLHALNTESKLVVAELQRRTHKVLEVACF